MTIDPLGRYLYLRRQVLGPTANWSNTTIYPYSIDAGTGAATAVNVNRTVPSSGTRMIIEPSGQFAYMLNTFGLFPTDNHIDAFAIDPATGVLTSIGTPVLVQHPTGGLACDASGSFLFIGNAKPQGTFDPSAPYNGSTLAIHGAGPTAGQLSAPGPGGSVSAGAPAIAVVQ
jgi:hypothetical protein